MAASPSRAGLRETVGPSTADAASAFAMRGIVKRFPGVLANDHTDFEAARGEIHALLGENGAGKTTLMHVLTGLYRPDEGEISLGGEAVTFSSPREALDAGVGMVHQHFRLVERFTVAENVMLGDRRGAGRRFFVNPHLVERSVHDLGERYGLPVNPRAFIWQLSLGEQQRVEILNALYQEARILILDEPTSVLTPQEAETLFTTLRRIAEEGRTVVFISHKLHEVMAVSDRITVLRGGRTVATLAAEGATPASLAALMVGHDLEPVVRAAVDPAALPQEAGLELEGVWVDGDRGTPAVSDASFAVRTGEIVAVAGVSGNGQQELADAIAGLRPAARGSIRVCGRPLRNGDPRSALDAGVAYVPADRLGTAVAPSLPVTMNLALKSYRHESVGPMLRLRRMHDHAEELIEHYDIRTPGTEAVTSGLSGGNLQKLVLAREFSCSPRVLVAMSPTHGLDVAATDAVHRYLLDAAEHGIAVLLISEDLDEIRSLNDRILVMYEGRLSQVVDRDDVDEISLRMAGAAP